MMPPAQAGEPSVSEPQALAHAISATKRWMKGDQADGRDGIVAAAATLHAAAQAGHARAQYALARLYEFGLPRLGGGKAVRYPAQAMGWYVRAARQDYQPAVKRVQNLFGADFDFRQSVPIDQMMALDISDAAPQPAPRSHDPASRLPGSRNR